MNKVEANTNQLSLQFGVRLNGDLELRQYWESTENPIGYDKHLNKAVNVSLIKPMPRSRFKEFVLGLIFLVALCFAVLDSGDLTVFVITKIAAFLIFVLAYSEYKSLWNRKDEMSRGKSSSRERRRKFKTDAMVFFEGRNPIAYSVLYEPRLSYKRLCSSEAVGATWSKWAH